jgi:hypothetical protein
MNSSSVRRSGQAAGMSAEVKTQRQRISARKHPSRQICFARHCTGQIKMTVKKSSPSHPENYPERTLANIRLDL